MTSSSTFFCGIGGSGMLPLACIVRARGGTVAGSDRALDAGRLGAKFDFLRGQGIALFPQDGSGLDTDMTLVTSAAVEATIPDVARARELGLHHLTRPQLLAELLNAANASVAVGGTSGKSTVTGMIGWILHQAGRHPTVMNGAVMNNFVSPEAPFASALVGDPDLFISEVDESDGSIALYRPGVAVLNNVSLDHKEMDELRTLFGGFLAAANAAVVNLDDAESNAIAATIPAVVGFGFDSEDAAVRGSELSLAAVSSHFIVETARERASVTLNIPGRHNAQNALAALAAVQGMVPLEEAARALSSFSGLRRRLEKVGSPHGIDVIDDFAHNPDKIAATLATLTLDGASPGHLLVFFQPHGYGPLAKMGDELAATFAQGLRQADTLILSDPVYQGGTVDRSRGSEWLVEAVRAQGGMAEHIPERPAIAARLLELAQPGDTIAVLGARDDTLSEFAAELVGNLAARN
jgi:UDP-N-acetylmuramate--alanine ligase